MTKFFRELDDLEIELVDDLKLLIENVEVEVKKDLYIANKPVKDGLLPDHFGIVISWNLEVNFLFLSFFEIKILL